MFGCLLGLLGVVSCFEAGLDLVWPIACLSSLESALRPDIGLTRRKWVNMGPTGRKWINRPSQCLGLICVLWDASGSTDLVGS